jgi:hypothetical protein
MEIVAKFRVNGVTKRRGWDGKNPWLFDVVLNPVTSDSEENKRFYAATPSGELKLFTINEEVAKEMEPGNEYYLTFKKAN